MRNLKHNAPEAPGLGNSLPRRALLFTNTYQHNSMFTEVQACASELRQGDGACMRRQHTLSIHSVNTHQAVVHPYDHEGRLTHARYPWAFVGRRSTSREPPGLVSRLWWS